MQQWGYCILVMIKDLIKCKPNENCYTYTKILMAIMSFSSEEKPSLNGNKRGYYYIKVRFELALV